MSGVRCYRYWLKHEACRLNGDSVHYRSRRRNFMQHNLRLTVTHQLAYRLMISSDLYRAGNTTSLRCDNVRVGKDIQVDEEGNVHPGERR